MEKIVDYNSSGCSSSDQEDEFETPLATVGYLGSELSPKPVCTLPTEGGIGSSSWSSLKSYFVGMGFSATIVDKAIEENGEENADLLLETLLTYSALEKSSSESSESLNDICSPVKDEFVANECSSSNNEWEIEDTDPLAEDNMDRRASLLMMGFSVKEVDLAINMLGIDAPVSQLTSHIIAAQTVENNGDKDQNEPTCGSDAKDEEITAESLFGTMDKTLRLLSMGFSKDQISSAIDKFGPKVPINEIADSIFADQIAETAGKAVNRELSQGNLLRNKDKLKGKCKHRSQDQNNTRLLELNKGSSSTTFHSKKNRKRKKKKHVPLDDTSIGTCGLEERRVKSEMLDQSMPNSYRELHESVEALDGSEVPDQPISMLRREFDGTAVGSTYFFYGTVANVPQEVWQQISRFLFGIEPEFADSQFFSAFIRKEGYIHNLPTVNRFRISPSSPMTVQDALPHTKNWWPSWDTRKKLSHINSGMGIPQLCERLEKIVTNSQGILSYEQQKDILHHCKTLNLVWVGLHKLSLLEPDEVENILGYPRSHTQVGTCDPAERLKLLEDCFQTDTLGYHLSVLKRIFPDGLTLLSLFSGIGGAEVALYRLGIHLKRVVSVESSEINRIILRRWWSRTGQTGDLIQIEDIHELKSQKIQTFIKQFGGFDVVIGRNPSSDVPGGVKVAVDDLDGIDFPLFFEFVRVLTSVRSFTQK